MRSARKLAITTPIFYVNDNPHIGHLYTMLYADILARRARITRGHDSVMMFTGTDEHGQKIQSAAERQGLSPIDFCDKYSNMFKILADKAEISYNGFIRTTQVSHIKNVQNFWTAIQKNGLISKTQIVFKNPQENYTGWYSESDECFLPENELIFDEKESKFVQTLLLH